MIGKLDGLGGSFHFEGLSFSEKMKKETMKMGKRQRKERKIDIIYLFLGYFRVNN